MLNSSVKYLFYLLLLASPISIINAQKSSQKNPFHVLAGVDIVGPFEQLFIKGKTSTEVTIGIFFPTNFQCIFELGLMNFNRKYTDSLKSFEYLSFGNYYKIGLDYNIYNKNFNDERNYIFMGGRLAYGTTKYKGNNIIIPDQIWGQREYHFSERIATYSWVEVVAGIRSGITKNIAIGWNFRIKYLLSLTDKDGLTPYYLAGFGKSDQRLTIGLTYSLFIMFGK